MGLISQAPPEITFILGGLLVACVYQVFLLVLAVIILPEVNRIVRVPKKESCTAPQDSPEN